MHDLQACLSSMVNMQWSRDGMRQRVATVRFVEDKSVVLALKVANLRLAEASCSSCFAWRQRSRNPHGCSHRGGSRTFATERQQRSACWLGRHCRPELWARVLCEHSDRRNDLGEARSAAKAGSAAEAGCAEAGCIKAGFAERRTARRPIAAVIHRL